MNRYLKLNFYFFEVLVFKTDSKIGFILFGYIVLEVLCRVV